MKKLILVMVLLLSSCYNEVKESIKYETLNYNTYYYKGVTIKDNVGNIEFVQDIVDNLRMLEYLKKLNLLISNNITNIVITWKSNDYMAWVMVKDGQYFTDTIYLNGYYYFNNYYTPLYHDIIHESYHVILRMQYKDKEILEASERICQMME